MPINRIEENLHYYNLPSGIRRLCSLCRQRLSIFRDHEFLFSWFSPSMPVPCEFEGLHFLNIMTVKISNYCDYQIKWSPLNKVLFTFGKNSSQPAQISEYKKINPTKYTLIIKNATRPYILAFAESYDPLWAAYVDTGNSINKSDSNENNNFKINYIPSYGLTNSFNVNKTRNYTLIIEYQPQIWFSQGLTISTLSLAANYLHLSL
jgi:hypothetical protein